MQLLAIEPGGLRVAGIDCVDGTPVYDVKPYLPWCEALPEARADWAQVAPVARAAEAVVIAPEYASQLGESSTALVRHLLQLDVQPAYQTDPGRLYGMSVAGWNIRWQSGEGGSLVVVEVTRLG